MSRPDAAGADLGAKVHYVAVPADRDAEPVRAFGTQTADLLALADWLIACKITTVAMEATGVYWVPLFQILEDRGLEVCLVNARHVKNVPGRKTDVQDCQWLQYLHSVGLLHASFRPPAAVCSPLPITDGRRGGTVIGIDQSAPSGPWCATATAWCAPVAITCCACKRRSTR